MGLFDFLKKPDPNLTLPQNNKEIWFRDTYAIWSQGNYEAFQHFCGLEKNSENASHCRYILGRDWAIEELDRETAKENIKIREEAYEIVKKHEKPAYAIDWYLKL